MFVPIFWFQFWLEKMERVKGLWREEGLKQLQLGDFVHTDVFSFFL